MNQSYVGPVGTALFSDDRVYRYALTREIAPVLPGARTLAFCCLNPSKADHRGSDPSVVRMMGFAATLGFHSLIVGNAFGLVSTDPKVLLRHPEPVGPGNDEALVRIFTMADMVILGWGSQRVMEKTGRDRAVLALLKACAMPAYALRINKDGAPAHPLYLPKTCTPVIFRNP